MDNQSIRNKVLQLVEKYGTARPFALAEACDIDVRPFALDNLHGLFLQLGDSKIIFINETADENMQDYICAHELGHALLHEGLSAHRFTQQAFLSDGRMEREANIFAMELLVQMSIEDGYHYSSVYDLARCCGVPAVVADTYAGCYSVPGSPPYIIR